MCAQAKDPLQVGLLPGKVLDATDASPNRKHCSKDFGCVFSFVWFDASITLDPTKMPQFPSKKYRLKPLLAGLTT